jgi:hypothetical protein
MKTLRYTLIADGSSDRVLIPILDWVLKQHLKKTAIQAAWADLRSLKKPLKELHEKIGRAIELYPCDVLFIHRDAESQSRKQRLEEIETAMTEIKTHKHIPVIPVRMQEAWLLIEESAIRQAAGNPNGRERIELPKIKKLESLPDPKEKLYQLLVDASGLTGRQRKRFEAGKSVHRLVDLITDFSALRKLSAFNALETDIKTQLSKNFE